MDINETAKPEIVERRPYKGFVIEVELYKRREGGYYAWPYVEKSHKNGQSKRHFVLGVEGFATKDAALEAAIEEGHKLIDGGFDPEQLG